eukprot:3237103-Amphidinium_carterae.1
MGLVDDEYVENLFNELPNQWAYQKIGPRLQMSRWMAWIDVATDRLSKWHLMSLVLCYLGIQNGWFKSPGDSALVQSKAVKKPVEQKERVSKG